MDYPRGNSRPERAPPPAGTLIRPEVVGGSPADNNRSREESPGSTGQDAG